VRGAAHLGTLGGDAQGDGESGRQGDRGRGDWKGEGGRGKTEERKGRMEEGKGKMKETPNRRRRMERARQEQKDHPFSILDSPSSVWVECEPWEFDGAKWAV